MGCEVEDLWRQRERPSACQHGTDSPLPLSIFYCLIQAIVQTHTHKRANTPFQVKRDKLMRQSLFISLTG